uniref:Vacuolar protein sorting-associated protein 28 homolog n=1 Tax=Syphacia muris TaxID=451379 RepID=A0A0N5AKF5_9BILA
MSSTFQRAEALTMSRLKRYLDTMPSFELNPQSPFEESKSAYKSYLTLCEVRLEEITDAIVKINANGAIEKLAQKLVRLSQSVQESKQEVLDDLPKLEMSASNGQLQDWSMFWSYFERKIDPTKMDKLAGQMNVLSMS